MLPTSYSPLVQLQSDEITEHQCLSLSPFRSPDGDREHFQKSNGSNTAYTKSLYTNYLIQIPGKSKREILETQKWLLSIT